MPGAPCLPAAAAIDHLKSKEVRDVSGGLTVEKKKKKVEKDALFCRTVIKNMSRNVFPILSLLNLEPFKASPQ